MPVYLIRHAKPLAVEGLCYGSSDVEVGDCAVDAARIRTLLPESVDACYSSPLKRCRRLAETLYGEQVVYEPRLQELHFGAWELQPWLDIDGLELAIWSADVCANAPPHGECFAALAVRVQAFLAELPLSDTQVVITHAGVIRAVLAQALALPLAESFRLRVDYAGVSQIDFAAAPPSVGFINRL
jgi:alpha-ribazole phosphatase